MTENKRGSRRMKWQLSLAGGEMNEYFYYCTVEKTECYENVVMESERLQESES